MENFKAAIVYMIVGLIFVVGGAWISSILIKDTEKEPSKDSREIVECPADFKSYQELVSDKRNVVNLLDKRTPMYVENGDFKSTIVVTKVENEKSKVACGYLFIKAGTETNGPLQKWENLYINPNEFGGHISDETNIGLGDAVDHSEYLFPLSKMSYWKTRAARASGDLSVSDWGVLLNVSPTIKFDIGLNTNDTTGYMDEFSIAYKCWNPATGEENHDCSIRIE